MKESARVWASVLSVAFAIAWSGWDLYREHYVQHHPWSEIFSWHSLRHPWCDLFCLCACMVISVMALIDILGQKHKINLEAQWYRRLDAVVDIKDFKDADCLYGYLEPNERKRLMQTLERMPRGARSLQKAIRSVSPELIDDAAEQSACT